MSSSENDSRLPYKEITKIETEHNWRIVRLLIGLSAGIFAFSLQTFENNANYNPIIYAIIYASWTFLFISFASGLLNVHLFQKILTNVGKKRKAEEAEDPNVIVINKYGKKIEFYNVRNKLVAYILRISFMIGVTAFIIFKLIAVTSSDQLGQVQEKGNKMAEIVRNQELLALNILEIQAQIRILEKKGMTNKDEILEEVKKLQVEMEEKIKKMGKEN